MVLSCLLHFSEPGPMKVGFKIYFRVFPGGSAAEESACNVGALGLIPGLGRSPKEGKGYPLQCSGLENSMDCVVHGVAKNQVQLSDFHTGDPVGKDSACNARDLALIPGFGKSPGERNGNPLQYSYLGNPMDRGAWWATVHGVTKSWT